MPLQFQVQSLIFGEGIDTKSDPKAVIPTRLLELENGVFTRPGIIAKRYGHDALSPRIFGSTSNIAAAQGLAVYGDELLLFSGSTCYAWAPALSQWVSRATVTNATPTTTSILHNSASQANPDGNVIGSLRCLAWEDSRGGIRYSIQDMSSGSFYVADAQLAASGDSPKIVVFNGEFVVFYSVGGNNLTYKRIAQNTPNVLGPAVSPTSTMVGGVYDAVGTGNRLFLAWTDSFHGGTDLGYLDASYTYVFGLTYGLTCTAIGLTANAQSNVILAVYDGSSVRLGMLTYNMVSLASKLVETIGNVVRVGAMQPTTTDPITVLYEISGSSADVAKIRKNTVAFDGSSVGTPADLMRGVGLWTLPGARGSSVVFVAIRQTNAQSTYFLIDSTANIIAKVKPNEAGPLRTRPLLGNLGAVSSSVFEFAHVAAGKLVSDVTTAAGPPRILPGVEVTRFDFASPRQWMSTKLGAQLAIAGGIVRAYDGLTLGEAGFHQYPEGVTAATAGLVITVTQQGSGGAPEITTFAFPAASSIKGGQYFLANTASDAVKRYMWFTVDGVGADPAIPGTTAVSVAILSTDTAAQVATKVGTAVTLAGWSIGVASNVVTITNTANGVTTDASNGPTPLGVATGPDGSATARQYLAIYERSDAQGRVTRSATSIPLAYTSTTSYAVSLTVPTLRQTAYGSVRIAVYRTLPGGSVFHRVTPIGTPTANSTNVDTVTFVDTYSDAQIAAAEYVYTTGGKLNAAQVPAATLVAAYKSRIFLAGQANPYALSWSIQGPPGTDPVYWPEEFTTVLEEKNGKITGLASLDDKLAIFTERAVYVIAGDGPNAAGFGNDFGTPALITTDVGCSAGAAIAQTPEGLIFPSPKGLYLLDRSLTVSYVGAPVEQYNAQTWTGAQLVASTNQVRVCASDGPTMCWDYLMRQWSTFTGLEAVGSALWQGRYVLAQASGQVLVESSSKFTDGDAFVKLRLRTANISFAGLVGYQRVSEIRILGSYRGAHKLRVQIGTDNGPPTQEDYFDAGSLLGGHAYSVDSPYGVSGPFGGAWAAYEWGIRVVRAKSRAISITLEDSQNAPYNEGMAINGIALRVGIMPGLSKIPANRRA